MRKEHPVPSPEKEKQRKRGEAQAIVLAETAPPWAQIMQQTLIEHVSQPVQGLKADVDEAKALALEAQAQIRCLTKEVQELRDSRANSPATMRSLRSLETEFEQFKASASASQAHNSKITSSDIKPEATDSEKRARTVVFGTFPQDTKSSDV